MEDIPVGILVSWHPGILASPKLLLPWIRGFDIVQGLWAVNTLVFADHGEIIHLSARDAEFCSNERRV